MAKFILRTIVVVVALFIFAILAGLKAEGSVPFAGPLGLAVIMIAIAAWKAIGKEENKRLSPLLLNNSD